MIYDILNEMRTPGKKIWMYGDSFSFPTSHPQFTQEYYSKCDKYDARYQVDMFWFNYISNKRKLKPIILSHGGHSNSWILRSIVKSMKYWKSGDEIYIGHTYPHRYELAIDSKFHQIPNHVTISQMKSQHPWVTDFYKNWILSPECQLEYWDNLNDIVEFGKSNGLKIKSWFWGEYFNELENFSIATNRDIVDDHPSPKGQYKLYEIIENLPWYHQSKFNDNYNPLVDGVRLETEKERKVVDFFRNLNS